MSEQVAEVVQVLELEELRAIALAATEVLPVDKDRTQPQRTTAAEAAEEPLHKADREPMASSTLGSGYEQELLRAS